MRYVTWTFLVLTLVGCGGAVSRKNGDDGGIGGINGSGINYDIQPAGIRVRSRATMAVHAGTAGRALTGSQSVSVTNSQSSSMTLDSSEFVTPTISNAILSFGELKVASLIDNNLDICGTNSDEHCGTGVIRIYTTGTAEAGLYNAVDDFGAPIFASAFGGTFHAVGLTSDDAAVIETISIPSTQHVITLADFDTASYSIRIDLRKAGAGSYSTTLVVEYAIAD